MEEAVVSEKGGRDTMCNSTYLIFRQFLKIPVVPFDVGDFRIIYCS